MRFYNTAASNIKGLHMFGQLGHIPCKTPGPKLKPKAQVERYLHRLHRHHILVKLDNGKTQKVRDCDFRPYEPLKDPKVTTHSTFHNTDNTLFEIEDYKANAKAAVSPPFKNAYYTHLVATKRHVHIPTHITPNTQPPKNKAQALLYPDAKEWMAAIDNELDKIDARGSVDWSKSAPDKRHRPIPFTVNFEYKRNKTGTITE